MSDNKGITGYIFEGKEITTVKKPGRPPKIRNPDFYPQQRKTDAATLYCVYGDLAEVNKFTDVPIKVLQAWRNEPWWVEIQKQVYVQQNDKLSARISSVLDKAIDQLADRLDNGDQTYNPKTGEISRKPIEAKVLASMFETLSHQRRITRGEPTAITARIGVADRLNKLEEAFIRFAKAKQIEHGEIVDAIEEGEVQEDCEPEYQDGDAPRETSEASSRDSDEQSGKV